MGCHSAASAITSCSPLACALLSVCGIVLFLHSSLGGKVWHLELAVSAPGEVLDILNLWSKPKFHQASLRGVALPFGHPQMQVPQRGLPPTTHIRREALVMVVRNLDECRLKRLVAISMSASQTARDVRQLVLLHDPAFVPDVALNSIAVAAGILIEPQPFVEGTGGWNSFGDPRSGLGKPSFVRWAVDHGDRFDFFWHIEDDVFFTGAWTEVFDSASGNEDFVGVFGHRNVDEEGDPWLEQLVHNCSVGDGQPCVKGGLYTKVDWMLNRVSGRLLNALSSRFALSALEGGAYGHHEVLTGTFCDRAEWCSMTELPSQLQGHFITAGWGPYQCEGRRGTYTVASTKTVAKKYVQVDCTVEGLALQQSPNHVLPGRLYHPAKCDMDRRGDPGLGDMALRWASSGLKTVALPHVGT
jgi:hypothetical protein